MKRRVVIHLAYFLALGLVFAGAAALAGSVSVPNTFTAGTTARAGEVNANFSAVQTAVNDNDSRIAANESDIATNTADIAGNASAVSANATDIATNAANIGTNASNITANTNAINALNAVAPLAWGQSDVDLTASSWTTSLPVEINSLTIDVPSDGVLVISGSVYIESSVGGQTYVLTPFVETQGVPMQTESGNLPNDFAASFQAGSGGNAGQFTLSYTVTVPINAGSYTVYQNAGPTTGPVSFDYNKNYLTVVFYPSTQGTFEPAPADPDI